MDNTNLLNLSESAKRVSVTEETLRQYVKLGFLKPTSDNDQLFFSTDDLSALFGIRVTHPKSPEGVDGKNAMSDKSEAVAELDERVEPLASAIDVSKDAGVAAAENPEDEPQFVQKNWRFSRANLRTPIANEVLTTLMGRVEPHDETMSSTGNDYQSKSFGSGNYELVALNRRLQEEIRMLKDERDWLRMRLEKLEARAERDQMLLLSESENIRGLVAASGQRRSFWAMALPWFKNTPGSSR